MLAKSEFAQAVGARIRTLRKKKCMSQGDLGDRVGYTPGMITMIELGSREPSLEKLVKIAYVLNCSTDFLLGRAVTK